MRIVQVRVGKNEQFAGLPGFVYAGRDWAGYKDCGLGNPFNRKSSGRTVLAEMYRRWLWEHREGEAAEAWRIITTLSENTVLGCWCTTKQRAGEGPLECHCDVIARAWKYLQSL